MSMCMQRESLLNLGAKLLRICFVSLLIASSLSSQALADVKKEDGLKLQNVSMPMYQWQNDSGKPRAVAILIHGLTMHGGIYDKLARHLAEQGYKVIAPDLHGYGRWADLPLDERICKECGAQVCYQKSRRELLELIDEVLERIDVHVRVKGEDRLELLDNLRSYIDVYREAELGKAVPIRAKFSNKVGHNRLDQST